MAGVLCIDFGTSSIRAALRESGKRVKVLPIGRVTKSRLDEASIRSEIHIDLEGKNVRYGERAIGARHQFGKSALYEASPKLWFKDLQDLHHPAVKGVGLTRANLLAGLLANAIRACVDAESMSAATLNKLHVRIAHPVWPKDVAAQVNTALRDIGAQAKRMACEREWATVTVATLQSCTAERGQTTNDSVDVVEPIAAAVDLLPSDENVQRLCAVIDIGAGTTDIGLFQAVVPDSVSNVRDKLYQLGLPKSVFKAGNFIDALVLELLVARASRSPANAIEDVKSRIRQIKETLFRDGFIQELGVDVQIQDLHSHPAAKALAREIRTELEELVIRNSTKVVDLLNAKTHKVSHLEVVMAGGGGAIDFIQKAISTPISLNGGRLLVKVTEVEGKSGLSLYGAGRGRMAVALGGASLDYEAVIHERPPMTSIRLGPM